MNNKKQSKNIEVLEVGDKKMIFIKPGFLKEEKPTKVTPSIITLEGNKMKIDLDLDVNINVEEEDIALGLNMSSDKNFSLKGIWYTKREHVTGISGPVDKILNDENDEEEFEIEYTVNICTASSTWSIRTKGQEAQEELITILLEWYYGE